MFYKTKTFTMPLLFGLVFLACTIPAQADPIVVNITLTNSFRTVEYPNTIVFRGTITNTSSQDASVGYLGLGVDIDSPLIFRFDPFILGQFQSSAGLTFPAFSSTGEITLFTVDTSRLRAEGPYPVIYNGRIEFGRINDPARFFHASAGFTLTVPTPPPVPTPEPATLILLGTGLAGVAASIRRRRGR